MINDNQLTASALGTAVVNDCGKSATNSERQHILSWDVTARLSAMLRPMPLPRLRAFLTLAYAAAALLATGGALEYGTGSPDAQGHGQAVYWFVFFAFHAVGFGGATLIGGFPGLARRSVKLGWVTLLVGVYGISFGVWYHYQTGPNAGGLGEWIRKTPVYLPALVPLVTGLLWGTLQEKSALQ